MARRPTYDERWWFGNVLGESRTPYIQTQCENVKEMQFNGPCTVP